MHVSFNPLFYRTKYDDIPVVIGPSLHSPILRKPEMKTFDGIHFNARVRKYRFAYLYLFNILNDIGI